MLSTNVDAGDTAVIQTHKLAGLMEIPAGRVDRPSITPICYIHKVSLKQQIRGRERKQGRRINHGRFLNRGGAWVLWP